MIDPQPIVLPVKAFLTIEACPAMWRSFDLYLFRDESVVFYVGQSRLAFDRVWEHIRFGFKGRSAVGRFILCNWPASMKFTIELLSSRSDRFAAVNHDLDMAERQLITQYAPCFNDVWNDYPAPLPEKYIPETAVPRCSRNLKKLIREAEYALKADARKTWLSP